ncbi:MAG: hypothetical protein RMJ53_07810 [Chitinophagales bacterium]|nr:hypothetical protein [Chitinophagales bacterium]
MVIKSMYGVSSAASAFASLRVEAAEARLLRGSLSLPPRPRCPVAEPVEAQRGRGRSLRSRPPHPSPVFPSISYTNSGRLISSKCTKNYLAAANTNPLII